MRMRLEYHFVNEPKVIDSLFGDTRPYAPLQPGSARRKMLRALGFIGRQFDEEIATIAKIRNAFGHLHRGDDHERMSFESPAISLLCGKLKIPRTYLFDGNFTAFYPFAPGQQEKLKIQIDVMSNRDKFTRSAFCLYTTLMVNMDLIKNRPNRKDDPGWIEKNIPVNFRTCRVGL